ncbi:hypothetical protein CEE37_03175 [candidate division LCP-89 bacterium B3_LCP]|uniref:Secretion system C-terminal sorting domain-containing protein n=1 Tax=candidate division LCP-89 bacterium B3_LCP TaxID=2012998 RepID=A0A532V2Y6_UNCL8|nr:MAG: hypothetical protein CEE37_03175 [candidate division LCP-89 bacterium B3_LCP]
MRRTVSIMSTCLLLMALTCGLITNLQAQELDPLSSNLVVGGYSALGFDYWNQKYGFTNYGVISYALDASSVVPWDLVSTPGNSFEGIHKNPDSWVNDDGIFVADGYVGLTFVDTYDPHALYLGPILDLGGICKCVDADATDDYVYCSVDGVGMKVVDIGDNTAPEVVGIYEDPDIVIQDLKYRDGYVFLGTVENGLVIVDVNIPDAPVFHSEWIPPAAIPLLDLSFVPDGDSLYAALGNPGFVIIDISDLQNPVNAGGAVATAAPALGISAYQVMAGGSTYNYVAIAEGTPGETGPGTLEIFYPSASTMAGSTTTSDQATGVIVLGGNAYVSEGTGGFEIFNVYEPFVGLTLTSAYVEPGGARTAEIVGDYAYVANYTAGLTVMDLSVTDQPDSLASVDTPLWCYDVCVIGDYAYIVDFIGELTAVDILNPAAPVAGTPITGPEGFRAIDDWGGYLYVGSYNGEGIHVYEVNTNPAEPTFVITLGAPNPDTNVKGITCADGKLYASAKDDGVLIYDLINPAMPDPMPGYATTGDARMVFIDGNTMYVAANEAGVDIVDLSTGTPTLINTISFEDLGDDARGVTYDGDGNLFIAHTATGMSVYDVSSPLDEPTLVSSWDSPGSAYEVILYGDDIALLCDSYSLEEIGLLAVGIIVTDPTVHPDKFSFSGNYPNPFNASTTLTLSLPATGQVRVDVFDTMGRLVMTVFEGELGLGEHHLHLNAGTFASGSYIVKVNSPWGQEVQKMVLLK